MKQNKGDCIYIRESVYYDTDTGFTIESQPYWKLSGTQVYDEAVSHTFARIRAFGPFLVCPFNHPQARTHPHPQAHPRSSCRHKNRANVSASKGGKCVLWAYQPHAAMEITNFVPLGISTLVRTFPETVVDGKSGSTSSLTAYLDLLYEPDGAVKHPVPPNISVPSPES